jgi:multiple sugar transport system permease protein
LDNRDKGPQWNYLMATSAIVGIPPILVLVIFQKYIVQGVKISGIK